MMAIAIFLWSLVLLPVFLLWVLLSWVSEVRG